MADINGFTAEGFEAVRDAFAANFELEPDLLGQMLGHDVCEVGAAVSVLRRDRLLLWLGLGMVTVGMADTAWGMFDLTAPSWMDTTWLAAPMCIAIGAWHEPVAQHGERTRGWRALIVPFAAMATATIVLAVGDRHHIGTAANAPVDKYRNSTCDGIDHGRQRVQ